MTSIRNRAQCPDCGYFASVPDGVHELFENVTILLHGPPESHARLRQIYLRLKEAQGSKHRPAAEEAVRELSPKLAHVLKYVTEERFWNFLNFIGPFIAAFIFRG